MDKKLIKRAIVNALATALYVSAVGLFMSHASLVFGNEDKALTPVVVLMLLVLSASVTGSLLFGQPVMWYIDGKKKQAMQLLGITLGCFAVLMVITMIVLAVP